MNIDFVREKSVTGSSSSLRTLISREPIPEDCDEFTLKKKGNSTKEEFAIYNKVWCRREIRWVSQNFGSKRLSNFAVVVEIWILTDNFYTITWLVCALSLVVDRDPLKDTHRWRQIHVRSRQHTCFTFFMHKSFNNCPSTHLRLLLCLCVI